MSVDQAGGLRRAATLLDVGERGAVSIPVNLPFPTAVVLPGPAARPLAAWLRAAAEDIDRHSGVAWGLPVSPALEFAGALLGEDLGHNR